MNKKTLTGLLSVLCVLLCALVLFCACTGDNTPAGTEAPEVTTEAPAPVTDPETNAPETDPATNADSKVTYTIIVVDADGNPVANVDVQMCSVEGTCYMPVKTNENGVAEFAQDAGEYYVTIATAPEGYVADSATKHTFAEDAVEMTITLEKASAEVPTEGVPDQVTEAPTEAPTETETEDPLRVEYDIEAHASAVEFGAAGYPGKVFQLFNFDNAILLGDIDLSQYASMIVIYGSDGGAMLGDQGSEAILTANGAFYDNNKTPVEGVEVLASAPLSNPTAGWFAGDREVVININSDYNGPVYLCHKMGDRDGMAVSAIILMKKEPPKAWDELKDVVTHQSFDQLYTGTGVAENGPENVFTPGQSANWDFVADLSETGADFLTYWGWIGVKGELGLFGYQINDNAPVYNAEWAHDTEQPVIDAALGSGADTGSRMKISIDLTGLKGENTVKVLYKSADGVVVILNTFTVKMPVPPVVFSSNDALVIITPDLQIKDNAYPAGGYDEWDKVLTLKKGQTGGFWDMGWIAINTDVYEFGYLFGGASPLNNGTYFFPGPAYTVAATGDQIAAAQAVGATTAAAYLCACAEAALGDGENYVQVVVKLNGDDNQIYVLREYTVILEP